MSSNALEALRIIEPEKFGLKDIADAAMDEAMRLYNNQTAMVLKEIRDKPHQMHVTRAFAFAKIAQIADIAALDSDGFFNALRRVKAGGKF